MTGAACLLAVAMAGAAEWSAARAARVRPAVALVLDIESTVYREKLDDPDCVVRCRALIDSLQESVLDTLESRYPFVDWRGPDPTYTVALTWTGKPGSTATWASFRLLGPTARPDSDLHAVKFETSTEFNKRSDDGWQSDSLRAAWLKALPKALTDADLLTKVFGRVPLQLAPPTVKRRLVVLSAGRDTIGAAENSPPAFELWVHVDYPPDALNTEASIPLNECEENGSTSYSCPISVLKLQRSERKDDALDKLLRDGIVSVKGARVTQFTPARPGAMPGSGLIQPVIR